MRQFINLTLCITASLLLLLCNPQNSIAASETKYAIVLASAATGARWQPADNPLFKGKYLYITETKIKNRTWERLNLGFFDSRKQATAALPGIRKKYPGAWLRKANLSEIKFAQNNNLKTTTVVRAPKPVIPSTPKRVSKRKTKPVSTVPTDKLDSLMQQAKDAFKKQKYARAIRLFTAITSSGASKHAQTALELQGLARQRNGQKAQAAKLYERYLEKYPEGDAATRVRQRLAGLMTETAPAKKSIKLSSERSINQLTTFGSVSQFYRHDESHTDAAGSITTVSQLISFLDATAIQRNNDIEHKYQLTMDNTYDFLNNQDKSEFRFTQLYYDISSRKTGSSVKLGRQSLRIGGVLNRFDGINAGYQFTSDIRLSLLAGKPTEVEDDTSLNDHKTFYGFIFESGTFLKHWNTNIFYFDQSYDGIDDRTSVGAEIHFRKGSTSVFTMFDYDTLFNELNTAFFNANLAIDERRTAHINAFMRQSPPLSVSNALIGQPTQSLDVLLQNLNMNIEQLHQLAKARSSDSQTVTVGGTQKLTDRFQVNLDVTLASTHSTDATTGIPGVTDVPATPSTGTDFFISGQLVGSSLVVKNDTGVLGFRYFNTKASDTLALILNTRFPITREWRVYPRFQIDVRNVKDSGTQKKLRALFKTDYRFRRSARFDFEIGYEDTSDNQGGQSLGGNSLFYTLGYRLDF